MTWFGPDVVEGAAGLWIRLAASGGFLLLIATIYVLASIIPEQGHPSRYRVHRDDIISDESPSVIDVRPGAGPGNRR